MSQITIKDFELLQRVNIGQNMTIGDAENRVIKPALEIAEDFIKKYSNFITMTNDDVVEDFLRAFKDRFQVLPESF